MNVRVIATIGGLAANGLGGPPRPPRRAAGAVVLAGAVEGTPVEVVCANETATLAIARSQAAVSFWRSERILGLVFSMDN